MAINFESELRKVAAEIPDASRGERDAELLLSSGIDSYESLCAAPGRSDISADVRQAACWALGRFRGAGALQPLLQALGDESAPLSFEAAKSLVSLGHRSLIPTLTEVLLNGSSPHNRAAAAYALGMLGSARAVEPLMRALGSGDTSEVRSHAAEALGHIRDDKATDLLISSLKDESGDVRFWCAFALGEIGNPKAIPYLENLAATDNTSLPQWGSVRQEALNAIGRIQAPGHPST